MVKIAINYRNLILHYETAPSTQIKLLFPILKSAFQLEGNQEDYRIWASKFYNFDNTQLQQLGNCHEYRLFLVDKANADKLDPFLNNILPTIVCELANTTADGQKIISSIIHYTSSYQTSRKMKSAKMYFQSFHLTELIHLKAMPK